MACSSVMTYLSLGARLRDVDNLHGALRRIILHQISSTPPKLEEDTENLIFLRTSRHIGRIPSRRLIERSRGVVLSSRTFFFNVDTIVE